MVSCENAVHDVPGSLCGRPNPGGYGAKALRNHKVAGRRPPGRAAKRRRIFGGGVQSNGGLGIGLSPGETAAVLLDKIRQGGDYTRSKKQRFRRSASVIKMLTLALSAASTIILGLQNLNTWAGLAFALVAVGTLLGAVEPFFDWRSRWILMEEAQYRFRRLADDLEYLVASTAVDDLTYDHLGEVFDRYQMIWDDLSRTWLEHRREPTPSTSA
ncbi:DUF4231 domain-containing protein [Streptomyces sp. NPDC048045]|uniref:DUF4231 domain-containing protein n=1 Tax=Streptomyces sp. NPDC048045 TaxID=3154710 RepID=UPI003427CAB7